MAPLKLLLLPGEIWTSSVIKARVRGNVRAASGRIDSFDRDITSEPW